MAKLKKMTVVFVSGADERYVESVCYHLCNSFIEDIEIVYKNVSMRDLQEGSRALPYSFGSQKDFRYDSSSTPYPKLKGFEAKEPWALFSARFRYELEQLHSLIRKLENEGNVDCLVVHGSLVDRLAYLLSDPQSSALLKSEFWEVEVPKLVNLFYQTSLGYPTIYAYLMYPSKSITWSGANFGLTMAHHLILTTLWSDLANSRHQLGHAMDEGTNRVIYSSFRAFQIENKHNNDECAKIIDLAAKTLASMYGYYNRPDDKGQVEETPQEAFVDPDNPIDDLQYDNSYCKYEENENNESVSEDDKGT